MQWARNSRRQGEVPGSFKKTWVEKGFFFLPRLGSASSSKASGRRLGRAVDGRADEAESDGTKTCILQLFFSCAFDRTFQSAAASSTKQLDLTALTIQCAKVVVG